MQLSGQQIEELFNKSDEDLLFQVGSQLQPRRTPYEFEHRSREELTIIARQWIEGRKNEFRHKICDEWQYIDKIKDPQFQNRITLATALADIISGVSIGASPFLVSVLLIKEGLFQLCSGNSPEA